MQTSWILPSWIQPLCTKLWLNLNQSDSNSFILTQLDDGSHLEFFPCWIHTATLYSDTLLSSLRFTQKHSPSTLTLTQTNSIWLKLIHSHLTWWWKPSRILPSWTQPFCTKKTSLGYSDSTWWWHPSWTLPSWIQTLPSWIHTPCYLLSDSLKNTLTPLWFWLKLIQSDSNSFILT